MTMVMSGIEISDNDPPRPDLATPYNIIEGMTHNKKRKLYSIN